MASIADVFFRAFLDSSGLELDAQKAGDKAGTTLGSRMSKGISTTLRAGLGVIGAGAAIATKGLVELDNTMAQFTADTGLAGKEADKAKASILAMSGRNLQPMAEIGKVLAKVHTDLGLTGDAADATAERFLHFARVTGRDAGDEVKAFDDILDAWGLTADKSTGLMDKLIASHQKFGGSITENEAALSAMAPQLKALNLGVDDGIGLLNLFAASGLDASAGQKALNAAIQKLPPGENLQQFIARLSTIQDDGERARVAMDVFGKKAGAGLANAIKPGVASLDAFKISTEEASGAMERGRDAVDGTFGNRAQLALKGFATKLTEVGSAFGPALTGLASLASLGGAAFFSKISAGLGKGLAGAWKAAIGSSLVSGAITKGGSLAATLYLRALIVGDAITGALSSGWAKVPGSAALRAAIAKAASVAASGYLAALIVGDALSSALSAGWAKVAGTGSKATAAAGAAGKAAGLAFKLAFVVGIAAIADEIQPKVSQMGVDIGKWLFPGGAPLAFLNKPIADWNRDMQWPLGMKGAPEWAGGKGGPSLQPVAEFGDKVGDLIRSGVPAVEAAAQALADPIAAEQKTAQVDAKEIAKATPFEIAKSLREGSDPVKMSAALLKDAIENALLPAKEIAALQGELTGKALRDALRDKRPEVAAAAQAYKASIEERLFALRNAVPLIALQTGQTYADALAAKRQGIGQAAETALSGARGRMIALKADAATYGSNTGTAYGAALAAALKAKQAAVLGALRGYQIAMRAGSPPKPGAVLYGIDKWGAATGEAFGSPLVAKLNAYADQARTSLARIAGMLSGGGPALAFGGAGAAAIGAGIPAFSPAAAAAGPVSNSDVTHVNVQVPGLLKAETPADVVRSLRHLNAYGTFRKPDR